MCTDATQYDRVCKGEFAELHAKLDRLDETVTTSRVRQFTRMPVSGGQPFPTALGRTFAYRTRVRAGDQAV